MRLITDFGCAHSPEFFYCLADQVDLGARKLGGVSGTQCNRLFLYVPKYKTSCQANSPVFFILSVIPFRRRGAGPCGSDEKLRELIVLISEWSQADPKFGAIKLNKLLFHADFSSFLTRMGLEFLGASESHNDAFNPDYTFYPEKKQPQPWLLGKAPPPRKIQQQVPPLRYATVGMTNLLLGQSCSEELSPSN